jgi:hypothetical protein
MLTRHFRRAAVVLVVLGLAACSRNSHAPQPQQARAAAPAAAATAAAVPPAPAPPQRPGVDVEKQRVLMRAIFGDGYDPKADNALAVIEYEGENAYFLMSFVDATELPDGRTLVAINGLPSDENRTDTSAHASPGMLNVYALRREGTGWQVVERHENVATMGSMGNIGTVEWVTLGPGKPGLIVFSGGTWFGSSITEADIFEIGEEVRALGSYSQGSGNAGACMPETEDCWDVDSRFRFVDSPQGGPYKDLLVDYTGKHYTVTEDKDGKEVEHLKRRVQQTMRFHFDGKEYTAVSGTSPVPGI